MSISSLSVLSLTLLVFIISVDSIFHVYTHDDGQGNEEHCCLVRVREKFCLATPITRSLIQVDKHCHQTYRRGGKKRNEKYLDSVSRRLTVESVKEMGEKILLGLKTPLAQTILDRDLVCLASSKNSINLDKCSIEPANPLDNDINDGKKHKRHRKKSSGDRKRQSEKNLVTTPEVDTADDDIQQEVDRIEVGQPIRIREGHGLITRRIYRLNPNNIRPSNRAERHCWSWYRQQARRIRSSPSKSRPSCIHLNEDREQCLEHLARVSLNTTETRGVSSRHSLPIGSKLFCANQQGHSQMIGLYSGGKICFQSNDQATIEHQFSDIPNLSDAHQNKETLDFINDDEKFKAEFENDCLNHTTLVENRDAIKPHRMKPEKSSPSA